MSQVSFEIESLEKDVEFMSETYLFTKYFCTDLDISYVFSLCFKSLFSPCLPPFFEGMNTVHFSTCLTQHTGRAIHASLPECIHLDFTGLEDTCWWLPIWQYLPGTLVAFSHRIRLLQVWRRACWNRLDVTSLDSCLDC